MNNGLSTRRQTQLVLITEFVVIACLEITDPYWPLILKKYLSQEVTSELAWWSMAIYLAPFLATILTAPVWGHLGGVLGYKKMLMRCTIVLSLIQLLLYFQTSVLGILILRLMQGAFAGYTATVQIWLTTQNDPEQHSNLIGKVQGMVATGTVTGPIIGGIVSHFYHFDALFLVSSSTLLLITLLIFLFVSETKKNKPRQKKSKLTLSPSKNLIWYLLITATLTARWMSSSFFALYVIHQLHGNNIHLGIIYAIIALMTFIVAPFWGKVERKNRSRRIWLYGLISLSLLISSVSQILFGLTSNLMIAIIAATLWGAALGVINTFPFSLLVRMQGKSQQGIVLGFASSMSKLGTVLGIALGGFFFAHLGMERTFFTIAISYIAIIGLLLIQAISSKIKGNYS